MAAISVPNTFTNGTAADATEVNANFTALVDGLGDGTKDISVSAITAAGAATLNGAVTLGNATGDDIIVTGRVAADFDPKTASTYDMGDATQLWKGVYCNDVFADIGAVGTPSHSFHADTNTGMYSAGADTLNFATGGTLALTVSSAQLATFAGAVTVTGATTLNGAVTLGNATGDDITVTGYVASDIIPKTNAASDLGNATNAWQALYLDDGATSSGTIYFDAGSTYFIQGNTAVLDIGGFTSLDLNATADIVGLPHCYAAVNNGSNFDEGAPPYSFTGDTDTGIFSETADTLNFTTGGTLALTISSAQLITAAGAMTVTGTFTAATCSLDGAVTINESGADVDFRVEGDTEANLFVCDASTDRVGINIAAPLVDFHVNGAVIVGSDGVTNAALTSTTGFTTSSGYAAVFRNGTNSHIMELRGDNKVVINALTSVTDLQTDANGVLVDGASDARLKDKIKPYDMGLREMREIRAVTHQWREGSHMDDGGIEHPGFVADEVKAVEPRIVGQRDQMGLKDCLTFTGKDLMPMAVNSIQELSVLLDAALTRIERLEKLDAN